MADYVNTTNTIGFYKFSNSTWTSNSILNSNSLNWQASETLSIRSSPSRGIISHPGNIEKNKYKSRPSSLCIKESNCIWTNLPTQIGNSMTTEFWFYPKYLGNTLSPTNGVNATFPSPSNPTSILNSLQMTNPFLFNYGISSDKYYRTWGFYNKTGNSSNLILNLPILVQVGYCAINKKFTLTIAYSRWRWGYQTNTSYSASYSSITKSFTNCPPNRWYHVAIVQDANTVYLYINGKNITGTSNGFSIDNYTSSYGGKTIQNLYTFRVGTTSGIYNDGASPQTDSASYYISIGNRGIPCTGIVNYTYKPNGIYGTEEDALHPGYQDVIIDDLRVSKGVLYSGVSFEPPGISGYQLAYVNGDVYGYDDTYEFVKIAPDWDNKTDIQKQSIINTMGLMEIEAEDLKSIVSSQTDNIHMEVYSKSSNVKTCQLIENFYETIVKPSELLPNPISESDIKKIDFTYSISASTNSIIKVLLTTDLETYKTYNFELNSWVNTPLEDISSYGIPIDQVKNIPEADVMSLGDNFAFAYFLHLEPYEADCNINKLALDVSLTYAQKHCNQSIANYEYPMFNKLKVIFYEDGEFKVNYMDKP